VHCFRNSWKIVLRILTAFSQILIISSSRPTRIFLKSRHANFPLLLWVSRDWFKVTFNKIWYRLPSQYICLPKVIWRFLVQGRTWVAKWGTKPHDTTLPPRGWRLKKNCKLCRNDNNSTIFFLYPCTAVRFSWRCLQAHFGFWLVDILARVLYIC